MQAGEGVTAAEYLLAIEDLQAFARGVGEFLTTVGPVVDADNVGLPAHLGKMVSTVDEPMRAAERGGPTGGLSAVVVNITRNPTISVPLWWTDAGLPIGVHFLGRLGDDATLIRLAAQLEQARPWSTRTPRPARTTAASRCTTDDTNNPGSGTPWGRRPRGIRRHPPAAAAA